MDSKVNLREKFRKVRNDFQSNGNLEILNWQLARKVHSLIDSTDSIWASYVQAGSEADPQFVCQLAKHIKWAYPVIEESVIQFYIPHQYGEWNINQFKIKEPIKEKSTRVTSDKIQGILVPGIAFDRSGNRLGSGKGFYDKFLKNFKNKKVGFAFDVQISESLIPTEALDVPMDYVVTEKQLIKIERMAS